MSEVACLDCKAPYESLGVDLVLPDQVWNLLCPEGGVLCANCICKRLQARGTTAALLCWPDQFVYGVPDDKGCEFCGKYGRRESPLGGIMYCCRSAFYAYQ